MPLNLFGFRRDDSGDQRGLAHGAEPVNEDGGERGNLNEESHMTYSDVLSFVRRRKCMFALVGTGILLLPAIIVGTVCAAVHSGPVIIPTTPAPLTPITSATTTTKPTTTTTTTKTTSEPPHPVPSVPTVHPLPANISATPARILLSQLFNETQLIFREVDCVKHLTPTSGYTLRIVGVSEEFFGESDQLKHAMEAVSRSAVEALIGISYEHAPPIPKPIWHCL